MKPLHLISIFFIFFCCTNELNSQVSQGIEVIGSYKGEKLYGVYKLNEKTNKNEWIYFLTPTGDDTYKYIYQEYNKSTKTYVKLYGASVIHDLNLTNVLGYIEVNQIGFQQSESDKSVYSKITLNNSELFEAISRAKIVKPKELKQVTEVIGTYKGKNIYGVYNENTQNKKDWIYFLTPTGHHKYKYFYQESSRSLEPYTKLYGASVLNDLDLSKVIGYIEIFNSIGYTRSTTDDQVFSLITLNNKELFDVFAQAKILTPIEKDILVKKKKEENAKTLYRPSFYDSPFLETTNKAWAGYKASKTKTCHVCGGSGKEYLAERTNNTNTTYSEDDANYYKKTKTSTSNYYRKVKCYKCKGTGKIKQ